jgi:arsenate reductase
VNAPLLLHHPACDTCRRASRWLTARGVTPTLRALVEAPPTLEELAAWVPASGRPLRRWLNTSGQSYRALGKATIDAMSDAELAAALAADGKLVKRPVLVLRDRVMVGFDEAAWAAALGG